MIQRDDDRINKFNEKEDEDSYNEQYSLWKEDRKLKFGANASKMTEKSPLSRFGIGFLILLILLILLFARNRSALLEKRIVALENKVKSFEDIADRLSTGDSQMRQVLEQAQIIQQFKERFDRSEEALASRMDQIMINLNNLQKQMSKTKTSKTAKASPKTTGNRYHIVKRGETLYQIGPQYGLTVKQLRQLNKLGDGDTIHPGQKLVISP